MCKKLSSDPRLGRSNTRMFLAKPVSSVDMETTVSHKGRKSWDKEIDKLMKDFTVPKETRDRIISETKNETTEKDSNRTKYLIAYGKFKPIMMSI